MFRKIFWGASVGNILEFYDFALYGFLAPTIVPLFFPNQGAIEQLLVTFNVFAMGFLFRPIGAIFFGFIGDRYGRKIALSLSIFGMAIVTILIGILPTYAQIGIAAPILLSIARMIQGLCMGGEFSHALIFTAEHSNKVNSKQGGFISGCVTAAGVVGWLLAAFLCAIILNNNAYTWRFLFILGGLGGIVGYFVRYTMSDAYEIKRNSSNMISITKIFKYPFELLLISTIAFLMGIVFYGQFIFPNSFLPKITQIEQSTILRITTCGIFSYMVFLPIFGWVSDRLGYAKVMLIATLLLTITAYPLFVLLTSGIVFQILLSQTIVGVLLAAFMAPATYVMSMILPREIRCIGTALSYNLSASLFGGTAPIVYLFLYNKFQNVNSPALYLMFGSGISFLVIFLLYIKESRYGTSTVFLERKSLYH